MSDCAPCKKNKVFSQQFNNQGVIVERKTENKEMKTINFEEKIYERTLKEKSKSAVTAFVDFVTNNTVKADDKTYKQRLSRCSHCVYLKRKQNLPKGADLSIKDSCLICGCFLKAKASQIGEHFECPLLWWVFESETDFQAAFDEYQAKKNEKDYNKILALIDEKTTVDKKEIGAIDEIKQFFFEYKGGASHNDLIEFFDKENINFYYIGFYLSEMLDNKLIRLSYDNERKCDAFILICNEGKD